MAGNSRCGKINVLGQWKSSKKIESVKVSLHFVLLSLPLALKKKTKHFWLDKKRSPDFYIIYIWQRGLVFRKNLQKTMLRYPCPYLVLVVNQIGTRLSENPRFFVLYSSGPLGWSAFMFSLPVTTWWWAGLCLVAGVAIGLFARWVSKAWWNEAFPHPRKKVGESLSGQVPQPTCICAAPKWNRNPKLKL